jgi:N6-adenosine-specific RNA methylase IME4
MRIMNDIEIKRGYLPGTAKDLSVFVAVGNDVVNTARNLLKTKTISREQYDSILRRGQEQGEVLLDAKESLGRHTAGLPKSIGGRPTEKTSAAAAPVSKKEALAGMDITKEQASRYERIAAHPAAKEKAKAIARENNDIVTESLVLQVIKEDERDKKEQAREEKRQANAEKVETIQNPLDAQGLFQTIVVDPPWDWGDAGDNDQFGRARPDYRTMPLPEIELLPIGKIADGNCHLYLWATNRSLPKAFGLIEAWGFRYVTCITWVKPLIGMGNYFRGSTEQLLFAVKGSQPLKRKDAGTWFEALRPGAHSAKPDAAYSLIESCSHAPFIDVFGRAARRGWTIWGENGEA